MEMSDLLALMDRFDNELPPTTGAVSEANGIARFIDHTLLKAEATPAQIEQLCMEARQHGFAAVCVNPIYVLQASRLLGGCGVKTCTVVGFPLGAVPGRVKVAEARASLEMGAEELDMVIPVGLLKGGEYDEVLDHIRSLAETAHRGGAILKVIIETALLNRREKIAACLFSLEAGADFVKTSTGFGPGGATSEDVDLMRRVVGAVERMGVKASGGVRSLEDARGMLKAGANRLGTSSGVKIIQQYDEEGTRDVR
jgi:deoxyribose-phosphate aldolase